jgi:hypothetical protein
LSYKGKLNPLENIFREGKIVEHCSIKVIIYVTHYEKCIKKCVCVDMRKQLSSLILLMLVILLSASCKPSYSPGVSATANVYIEPSLTTVNTGSYFLVNVSIADVTSLAAWHIKLYYENSLLNGSLSAEGPFLKQGGSTFYWQRQFNDHYNQTADPTHGMAELLCSITGATGGVDGTGTLAIIAFTSIAEGTATLHLDSVQLSDPPGYPIPYTTTDGTVQATGKHDLAITSVVPSKTVVDQGYLMNITVTVTNLGDFSEVSSVTAFANTTSIASEDITLASADSANVTLKWDSTGFNKGNYTISAYVTPVAGEMSIDDNNLTGGWVIVAMVGDVTGTGDLPDGKCDAKDVALIASLFGVRYPNPRYKPNCDIVYDGKIDAKDVALVASKFGHKDP